MTDQELLTYAAKAAGIEIEKCGCKNEKFPFKHKEIGLGHWNPLEDDGEALRLAVKLFIDVHTQITDNQVFTEASFGNVKFLSRIKGDKLASLRRCITQAAAEIGKGM